MMPITPRPTIIRESRHAIAIVVAGVLAGTSLAACGGGVPGDAVVEIGQGWITKATVEHWTPIEASLQYNTKPTTPPPKSAVPDAPNYTACVAARRQAVPPPAKGQQPVPVSQLKGECEQTYLSARRHILEILITYQWLVAEDAAQHVKLTDQEVKQEFKRFIQREFANQAGFHRFLAATGMTASDEVFLVKRNMLAAKLIDKIRTQATNTTPEQREQALFKYLSAFQTKWTAKTTCQPAYATTDCKPNTKS